MQQSMQLFERSKKAYLNYLFVYANKYSSRYYLSK